MDPPRDQENGADDIRKGMCISDGELLGRSYPERFLSACSEECERCLSTRVDPDVGPYLGGSDSGVCRVEENRAKCATFPSVAELIACFEEHKALYAAHYLSIAGSTCSDYAATPLARPANRPAACEVVEKACPYLY